MMGLGLSDTRTRMDRDMSERHVDNAKGNRANRSAGCSADEGKGGAALIR